MEAIAWVFSIGIGLYLLFRFPKPMLILVASVVGIVGVVAAGAWVFSEVNKLERSRVMLQVMFDTGGLCASDHPLLVTFTNRTNKTLTKVSFSVHGKRKDYSSNIYSDYFDSDRILKPGETHQACWALDHYGQPYAPQGLEWSADVYSAHFDQ